MSRNIVFATATAAILLGPGTVGASNDHSMHPSARSALQYFEPALDAGFLPFLTQRRRPAPSSIFRARVMRNLPKEGELSPTVQEAMKLAIIPLVLAFHGRKDDMEFRLVAGDGLAFAGLHARTVLLITREALELLDRDELMAVVAHEVGHDYFWDEYEEAQKRGDHHRLQELELRCDGIAVITMERLRVDIARLVSAATTLRRHNQRIFRKTDDGRYVPLDQRVQFIRAMARLTARNAIQRSR
jgi:peptidase M48-like protein